MTATLAKLEEQIRQHKEISIKIDELELQKKALGLTIMAQMQGATLQIPGYRVRRCHRISISVPLDQARLLRAVKMEEVVDKEKIKDLYKSGQPIAGVTEANYIQVSITD